MRPATILTTKKWGIIMCLALLIVAIGSAYLYHRTYYRNNLRSQSVELFVKPATPLDSLVAALRSQDALLDEASFCRAARWSGVDTFPSGHYVLRGEMGNKQLIRSLRFSWQTPVRVTFNNLRTLDQLAGRLSKQLMLDSLTLLNSFRDSLWHDSLGFTTATAPALFLPDTYELWWNSSPQQVIERFYAAYAAFWNEKRRQQAADWGLSPIEVSILASIVEEESNRYDEWPIIAGLYLNRLKRNMPLQACPTLKFALNDFSLQRVLKEHTQVDSPYNTYRHTGLPPGPIRLPSKRAIDAVLQAEHHTYLYMCAKDDFSGAHYFSSRLSEHNRYAARYHRKLNQLNIR